MSPSIQKMPTLGQFNKIVCDSLGLWSTENKDVAFSIPAKEKERQKALREAFSAIKTRHGTYGNLDDLISKTKKTSPPQREETKKNKTIQNYSSHLAKEDFSSWSEFNEFKEYIDIVINDRFPHKELSRFSAQVHLSSIMYYREFIREHAAKPECQFDSYAYFVCNILVDLVDSLADKKSATGKNISVDKNNWPLRSFVDAVADLCDVSLHKLHQFHELRLNSNLSDHDIWSTNLKSNPINTKSKQVIDRISKNNKIKWDTFYNTINPFICLLPKGVDEDYFKIKAYSAFVINNITNHIREVGFERTHSTPKPQEWKQPIVYGEGNQLPVSDRIDFLLNDNKPADKVSVQSSVDSYHNRINSLRLLNSSLIKDSEVPGSLDFSYRNKYEEFPINVLRNNLDKTPLWLEEWGLAKIAVSSGNSALAMEHYKRSIKESKYLSGPLFVQMYIEICAFCKNQYAMLRKTSEEELFTRFYEPLGKEASRYAELLGYIPAYYRDPVTLMPKSLAPQKNKLLSDKINSAVRLLS